MQLLISDANILIDLEEGELLAQLFTLPYRFRPPIAAQVRLHDSAPLAG